MAEAASSATVCVQGSSVLRSDSKMEMGRAVRVLVNSLLGLLGLLLLCSDCEARDSDLSYVTCGSLLKLLNTKHHVRLHSHDVKYGSGRRPPAPSSQVHGALDRAG